MTIRNHAYKKVYIYRTEKDYSTILNTFFSPQPISMYNLLESIHYRSNPIGHRCTQSTLIVGTFIFARALNSSPLPRSLGELRREHEERTKKQRGGRSTRGTNREKKTRQRRKTKKKESKHIAKEKAAALRFRIKLLLAPREDIPVSDSISGWTEKALQRCSRRVLCITAAGITLSHQAHVPNWFGSGRGRCTRARGSLLKKVIPSIRANEERVRCRFREAERI